MVKEMGCEVVNGIKLAQDPVSDCCKHGNEVPSYIRDLELTKGMRGDQVLRSVSAPMRTFLLMWHIIFVLVPLIVNLGRMSGGILKPSGNFTYHQV
jgi:hypothetical protein